jgi:hypothetical protein
MYMYACFFLCACIHFSVITCKKKSKRNFGIFCYNSVIKKFLIPSILDKTVCVFSHYFLYDYSQSSLIRIHESRRKGRARLKVRIKASFYLTSLGAISLLNYKKSPKLESYIEDSYICIIYIYLEMYLSLNKDTTLIMYLKLSDSFVFEA